MNKVLLLSLFLSAILVALPTLAEEKTTVNTTDTSPYKLESRQDYAAGVKSCRGALIAPSWVLTAKHCLGSKKANNLGKHGWVNLSYTDELGQRKPVSYNAKAIFRHPFKNIGLMQLSEVLLSKLSLFGGSEFVRLPDRVVVNDQGEEVSFYLSTSYLGKAFLIHYAVANKPCIT